MSWKFNADNILKQLGRSGARSSRRMS